MKVVKIGNTYKRANWFKQNERQIYSVLCAVLALIAFILGCLIRG